MDCMIEEPRSPSMPTTLRELVQCIHRAQDGLGGHMPTCYVLPPDQWLMIRDELERMVKAPDYPNYPEVLSGIADRPNYLVCGVPVVPDDAA